MLFLQSNLPTPSLDSTLSLPTQSGDSLSLLDLLFKGGFVMIPIAILFVIACFLFYDRYRYISRASNIDSNFLFSIRELLYSGNVKGATDYCKTSKLPIARLLEKGLSRIGQPIRDIENAIENTARVEIYNMEKNLSLISAIAKIAPMFGFLGTVSGMIRTFHDISSANKIDISTIANGIYEKMITSATGLIVGIIAYLFYTWLTAMIERTINKMEVTAMDFLDILYKPASK